MIINVKKLLFFGVKKEIDAFFKLAQEKGFIEFIHTSSKRVSEVPSSLKEFISAIKILKKLPKQQQVHTKEEKISVDELAQSINQTEATLEQLFEEKRLLQAEEARISPFGDFSIEDLHNLEKEAKRKIQFFCIKTTKAKDVKIPKELIYIGTDYDLDYYIGVNKEKKSYPSMIEMIIEKPLGEVKKRLKDTKIEIDNLEEKLKTFPPYMSFLKNEFIHLLNNFHLKAAQNEAFFPMDEDLFMVEGWVPESKQEELDQLIGDKAIDYEVLAIEQKERIPTYMENQGVAKIGEDLVNIYDTPDISDKDPSIWVYFAFTIFFAMIVSDAGYGFIYFCIAMMLKFKIPNPKPLLRRFIKLVFTISLSTMIWGILSGSFFGVGISPDEKIGKYTLLNFMSEKKAFYHLNNKDSVYDYWQKKYPKLDEVKNGEEFLTIAIKFDDNKKSYEAFDTFKNNILMEISLFIGAIHICLSFLRNLKKNWSGTGWVIFIIGGYLFLPSMVDATSFLCFLTPLNKVWASHYGLILVYSGIAIATVLAIIQKKLQGVSEILHVIQIFADILSYLRIYALGLAGMIMATTFNTLGLSMPLFIGVFVIFAGHLVNFTLGIMGGIIHGLRLNFIEWYHYCFQGDGKLFNPLKLLKER